MSDPSFLARVLPSSSRSFFFSLRVLGGAESCAPKVAANREGSYTLSSSGNSPARLLLGDTILASPRHLHVRGVKDIYMQLILCNNVR